MGHFFRNDYSQVLRPSEIRALRTCKCIIRPMSTSSPNLQYNLAPTIVYTSHTEKMLHPDATSVCVQSLWRVECIFKVFSNKIGNVSQSQIHFFSTFFQ